MVCNLRLKTRPTAIACVGVVELDAHPQGISLRELIRIAVVPFLLAVLSSAACYWAAGASLGFFLGGVGFAVLLAGPLVVAEDRGLRRLIVAGALVDGIGIVWLVAVYASAASLGQWIGAYVVLAAYVAALTGLAIMLDAMRVGAIISAAITTVLGMCWLSWPIWLAPWLSGSGGQRIASMLVAVHPLFALNGLLDLGNWSEQAIAYRLMPLNQDVAYSLPRSIWPAVIVHAGLGAALLAAGSRRAGRRAPAAPAE